MLKNESKRDFQGESLDISERSIQKRKLLGNLLNYAMDETKSAKSGSEMNASRKSFNIPQHLMVELEELGFETLKIINDVMDQFSYLFSDKRRKKKI